MHLQLGQRVRIMWLRDVIASNTADVIGATKDTTVSGTLIPAGTTYDGLVSAVTADGGFAIVLGDGRTITLHTNNPAIAIAVLSQFTPRQE